MHVRRAVNADATRDYARPYNCDVSVHAKFRAAGAGTWPGGTPRESVCPRIIAKISAKWAFGVTRAR